jgi:hypothetical protein
MITYKYYKFPSKELVPKVWPVNVSINEIGTIYNNDGIYNELGEQIQPPTPKQGWHVNICYQGNINLSHLQQYEINVQSPNHIWYGQYV